MSICIHTILDTLTGFYYHYIIIIIIVISAVSFKGLKNPLAFLNITLIDIVCLGICLTIVLSSLLFKYEGYTHILSSTTLYCFIYIASRLFLIHRISTICVLAVFFTIIGVWEAVIGLLQYSRYLPNPNPSYRLSGTFGNPAIYANFLVSILIGPMILIILYPAKSVIRILSLALSLLIILAIIISGIRSAWVSLFLGSSFLFFITCKNLLILARNKVGALRFKHLILLLTLIILCGGVWKMLMFKKASTMGRIFVYESSLNMLRVSPFWGIGSDRFKIAFNDYQEAYFRENMQDRETAMLASHVTVAYNEFLQIWVELGLPGLLLIISLVVIWLRDGERSYKEKNYLWFSSCLAGTMFIGLLLFSYPLRIPNVLLNTLLVLSIAAKNGRLVVQVPLNKGLKILGFVLFVYTSIYFTYLGLSHAMYLNKWTVLKAEAEKKGFKNVAQHYADIYPKLKNEALFLYDYGGKLALDHNYEQGKMVLQQTAQQLNYYKVYVLLGGCYFNTKKNADAEAAYLKASFLIPNRFYPRYKLMKFYMATGQSEKAIKWAKIIDQMDVKISSPIIDTIKSRVSNFLEHQKTTRKK